MNKDSEILSVRIGVTNEEVIEIASIGCLFYQQGNIDKALMVFEGLVELNPNNFYVQSCLGAVYTYLRQDDKAIEHLDKAIALKNDEISPYVNRAEVNIRKLDIEKVITDISEAVKLDSKIANTDANRARTMLLGIYDALKTKGWINNK